MNAPWDVAVPKVLNTETSTIPVKEYAGAIAIIVCGSDIENDADTPPNLTVTAVLKFAPVIVTEVPPACGPVDGATP